ncbi:SHOCT domain-containing protein [Alteromonas sp.]|uniref:SHOCT domain-containing protein n=1 Tax=Alteromonas sp. TaxID=232 RepID=UPI000B6776BB|nr:SHOCT domain-containing protein [Alteromonas sp.]MAI38737.1 hypothetical protein [Alteromonas sp.]OUX85263.1 MAG: hypothetical protein CBB95_14090 [Alteromonas sp. TMED35]|tara:strand:+ start:34169 stop:35056 length:888 start_codon:yes stop_codon:yes gene_type:complete
MTNSKLKKIALINLLFLFLISPSLAEEKIIWKKGKNNFIQTKVIEEKQNVNITNNHPYSISDLVLNEIFSSISIQNYDANVPLFSVKQQSILSKHISRALSQASAREDIIFALGRKQPSLGGIKTSTYYTAGRIFITDNTLNLIIGDHDKVANAAYEMAYDPTRQGLVAYTFNHGSREPVKFGFDKPLVFGTDAFSYKTDDRAEWVVVDLLSATVLATKSAVTKLQPHVTSKHSDENEVARKQNTGRDQQPTDSILKNQSDDIVDRFEKLNALKDAGLISEEEYQQKRKQLLDSI